MSITSCFALALHALVLLAHQGEQGATSESVAESASTHAARVRRVLAPLVRARLVAGREGGGGGYVLARRPEEITLEEVYAALDEGPLLALHPRTPNARCPVGAGITPALEVLEEDVGAAVRTALGRRSVGWLASRAGAANGGSPTLQGTEGGVR